MLEQCKSGNKLAGVYLGTVLQHLKHGYCKILIHGVYPQEWETQPDLIPKAQQASPLFGGVNSGNGTFSYPNIGATVWCMFMNGDQNLPVYFAAALGGQNAYGQHDLTLSEVEVSSKISSDSNSYSASELASKAMSIDSIGSLTSLASSNSASAEEVSVSTQLVSDKHLITAGKTRVMFWESGKLSAVVEDPIRTSAVVDYTADEMSSYPVQEQVDDEEISNINCQLVMDNESAHGTISSSTHYWNPMSVSEQYIISSLSGIKTVIENTKQDQSADSRHIMDTHQQNRYESLSVSDYSYNKNTTDPQAQTTEQIINTDSIESENSLVLDGENSFSMQVGHDKSINQMYTFVDGVNQANCKLTSTVYQEEFEGELVLKSNADAGFKVLSSSNKMVTNQGVTMLNIRKLDNRMQVNGDKGIVIQAQNELTSETAGQTTVKKNRIHNKGENLETAYWEHLVSGYKSMNGTPVVDGKYEKSVSTQYQRVKESFKDNVQKLEYTRELNAKKGTDDEKLEDKARKVNVQRSISTASGSITILIEDKSSGKSSKITMDKSGNIKIEASTKITLKAPNIEIDGITHITKETTIDAATQIKSTLTTTGDATIKGSSYTGHVHNYIVPTYPAGMAPTTTRM